MGIPAHELSGRAILIGPACAGLVDSLGNGRNGPKKRRDQSDVSFFCCCNNPVETAKIGVSVGQIKSDVIDQVPTGINSRKGNLIGAKFAKTGAITVVLRIPQCANKGVIIIDPDSAVGGAISGQDSG